MAVAAKGQGLCLLLPLPLGSLSLLLETHGLASPFCEALAAGCASTFARQTLGTGCLLILLKLKLKLELKLQLKLS